MDRILTKYFWILNLFTLVLSAFLLAGGAGELVATEVSALLPPPEKRLDAKKKRRPNSRRIIQASRDGADILSRNIFDSVIGPIGEDEDDEFEDAEDLPASMDGLPVVACSTDSKVTLFATVAAQENPQWSFASIADNGENKLCRIGDEVDGRVVSRIFWKYLFLRGSSDECYVGLFDDGAPPMAPPKPVARPGAASTVPDDIKNGIHFISETERVVDRSIVDKLISNPSQFIRSVRVRPYRKDGKISGFKIRRFKPDSPLALLGAKKGDIIHSVNGIELTSVDKALGAYQGLRTSGNLTFSITRMGKPMELNVGIR